MWCFGNMAMLLYDVNDATTSFCLLHDLNPSINTYHVEGRDQPLASAQVPIQNNKPPKATLINKCCPKLHAMQYKYFGENTVQMNKCVLSAVHAAMTNATLIATKTVIKMR